MSVRTSPRGQVEPAKRRVLMVAACPFPARRGTPARILRMAENLGRRGHEVHIATYHLGDSTEGYPFTTHRIREVSSYSRLDPGPSYRKLTVVDTLLSAKILQLTRHLAPDVVHAHHYEGLLTAMPARLLGRTPIVYDAHVLLDGELEYYQMRLPKPTTRRFGRALDRYLPRRADHVIAVSKEIRDTLVDEYAYPPDFVTVVPNGVERSFFERSRGALPQDGLRRLIYTGNLAFYQGTDLMLRAFAAARTRITDLRLVVVTDSPVEQFESMARAFGVAEAIEYMRTDLERLPQLISSADIALNPRTLCPGTPMKLLNYLACAVPIVSFAGSAKYLEDHVNALVVADDDYAGFADAICRLLEDPALARRLAGEAGRFAEHNLSWTRTVDAVEDVYTAVLSRSRAKLRSNPPPTRA